MAIVVKDRVKENFTTTGTADFTLGGAVVGFQAFSAIGNNNFTYYAAVDPSTGDWEVGYGQYTTAGPTLTRNTILSSSAAGAKVSFGAGSKDVFCTYPSEKAIYEELAGNVLIDGGPITVVGAGVTSYTSFGAALAEMYANETAFAQMYVQNLNSSATASTDIVAYNDAGDGTNNFIDMGISSSSYSDPTYPIFTPGSGYVYNDGGELIIGSATDDVVLFAGGVAAADEAVRIDKTSLAVTTTGAVNVGGALDVNGAADIAGAAVFGSTVTLNANPSLALQAATKAYVDNQVTAGIHIHEPVRVETTGNLTATYTQGGTTFNITTITGTNTVTTSVNHGLSVNDQIWLYSTAGNGLSTNTAYFVYSTPALNQLTLSLTFGGAQITGLTNATGLTYATRANSGVGAFLTNAGTKAALQIDGVNLSATDRVMVRLQTTGAENGVYTVTTVGTPDPGGTNWVLTRAVDASFVSPSDPNGLGTGDYFFTREGLLNAGDSHVLTTEPNTMIIGYTTLTYTQFSGGIDYVGGTNIDVTGQTISLTGTVAPTNGGTGVNTVTTGDLLYGSAANTWSKLPLGSAYRSLSVNGAGTQVEWNAVALDQSNAVSGTLPVGYGGTGITGYAQGEMLYANTATTLDKVTANTTTTKKFLSQTGTGTAGQAPTWAQPAATDITGLAPSATTDTTDASNITSGTLGTSRLSGSYTGVTGVGTLTAGTWNATAIGAVYGGTGQSSYAVGDLLYADTTTSLAKLADVAVGNALISGGVAAAPSWGKIGLATHVSGTLPIANGGTNSTATPTNGGVVYGTGTAQAYSTAGTSGQVLTSAGAAAPTWTTATNANTASAIVQRDASGNFSAGTITAALSGNATTATSATTATTATTLATARNINEVSFNGSANITIPRVASIDDRTTAPADGSANYATFGFGSWNNNNTSPYTDYWLMRGYSDASGGNDNMVAFRKDALGMRVWQQTYGSATAFSTFKDVAWTDGTNSSGTWGISVTGNAATATTATQITNAGSGIYAAASGTAYSSVVCVREAGNGGAGASAPRLGFHWGGVVASSIAIEASGRIAIANNPGNGYEAFVCAALTATTGTFSGNISAPNVATNANVMSSFSSPGTWTKPATLKAVKVTVVGAGGNGGPGSVPFQSGGGGGAGGTAIRIYPAASLPGPQPYTVGANPGGSAAFGAGPIGPISATGGANGGVISNGGGGAGSGGNYNVSGGVGGIGLNGSYFGGIGGSSSQGGGTNAFGAGGQGASANPGAGTPVPGRPGVIIFEEYY